MCLVTECVLKYRNVNNIRRRMKENKAELKTKLKVLIECQLNAGSTVPLNIYELRNYIYFGFSDEVLRADYWKVLIGYYSTDKGKNNEYYKAERIRYQNLVEQSGINDEQNKINDEIKELSNKMNKEMIRNKTEDQE